MTALEFLVLVLATQRLTTLWFEEVALPLRHRLLKRAGRLGYLAGCRLCVSVWAAAGVFGCWQLPLIRPLLWVLALSGGMLILETLAAGGPRH